MYKYEEMKKEVFTETGFRMIDDIRKNISGRNVFDTSELIKGICGDSFQTLACIDWLVENNEIELIFDKCARNYWVYRRKYEFQ